MRSAIDLPVGEIVELNAMSRDIFEKLLVANHTVIDSSLSLAFNSTDIDVPDILFKWSNYFMARVNSALKSMNY